MNDVENSQDNQLPPGLYIIATPIGNIGDMTLRAIETLQKVDLIACEDTRTSSKLTGFYNISTPKIPYHEHNAAEMRPKIIAEIKNGKAIALISDAGTPLVSDPGYKLVEACAQADLSITALPGASAPTTALVLSGLPTDQYFFAGFLPAKSSARQKAFADVAEISATLLFFETARRLQESLADALQVFGNRKAAVARELTKKFEEVQRGTLQELVDHYAHRGDPKGEIVLVIAGAEEKASTYGPDAVKDLLQHALNERALSVKDASAEVATQTGMKKRDVYALALSLLAKTQA